jgi:hypothetical protein
MEAIRPSETSVLTRATRRHLPEDDNHHSHRRGNLKSYMLCCVRNDWVCVLLAIIFTVECEKRFYSTALYI